MSSSTPEAQALRLLQAGQLAEAEVAWRAILERTPADATALNFLGCILAQTSRQEDGLRLMDKSIELVPRNAMFLSNRAGLLNDLGRFEDAARDLRRSVQVDPKFMRGYFNLGTILRNLGRHDEAVTALRRAVALAPRDADVLMSLARSLQHSGRIDEAIAQYALAVQARPVFPEALVHWGNALKDRGDLEGAARLYARAVEQRPDFIDGMLNAAGAALDLERIDEARARYLRIAELRPDLAEARFGLGLLALREQRFADGWEGYERRFDTQPPQSLRRGPALPEFSLPLGSDFSLPLGAGPGRGKVALWMEQGIGDQLLFSTLLPDLASAGIEAVVEVDPRLLAAYRRSLPAIEFTTPRDSPAAFASCDSQLPIGSLPRLFRPDAASFARQPRALLVADAARVEEMRTKLGPGKWIAISWRSLQKGARHSLAERKSIPLEHFARLAESTGARLLDVQYGDVAAERAAFDDQHPGVLTRIEGLDLRDDLEGVMAAIAACDSVVTASNALAHLAGAIGKRAFVVYLRGYPPFHYWAPGPDGHSLWYPSVEVPSDAGWTRWDQALQLIPA